MKIEKRSRSLTLEESRISFPPHRPSLALQLTDTTTGEKVGIVLTPLEFRADRRGGPRPHRRQSAMSTMSFDVIAREGTLKPHLAHGIAFGEGWAICGMGPGRPTGERVAMTPETTLAKHICKSCARSAKKMTS